MNLNRETLKNFMSSNDFLPSHILTSGIIHFGVGGFHRAHEAVYTEDAMLKSKDYNWGIVGIEVMPSGKLMNQVMKEQDCLYTLMTRPSNGKPKIRVISSIHEYIYKYDSDDKIDQISRQFLNEDIKIISLTITEGGYNINQRTGDFNLDDDLIKQDIQNFDDPKTIFGHLAKGIRQRKNTIGKGVTFLSCDNIQHNGDMTKKMFLTFLEHSDRDLMKWVEENCSFPNSMVDRITPKTTEEDKKTLRSLTDIDDLWPVTSEPFSQWIIEDNFIEGRPQWELAGAQFVDDVSPYEKMKLRLLNASHQALSYFGFLIGYRYVHEAALDPVINKFVRYYMKNEVVKTLDPVPGVNIEEYQNSILERFSNPNIKDTLSRNCENTSDRIPVFNIPTMVEQIGHSKELNASAMILASWAIYALGKDEQGNDINIIDNRKEEILTASNKAVANPENFLKIQDLFGCLASDEQFVKNFIRYYHEIKEKGCLKTISDFLQL
ncbi:MAG: mannitol dehydrogenase family protein [Oligoflexales bacterium]